MRRFFTPSIVILLGVAAYFGYRPLVAMWSRMSLTTGANGQIACDYKGRAYNMGEQRRADDACNVCTCGENGWSCTKVACMAGSAASGTITGTLAAPTEKIPAERVCAIDLEKDQEYCQQTTAGTASYSIVAPPGTYWVYASIDSGSRRAYDTEYLRCGSKPECKDHSPVEVTVESGQIAKADPKDWSTTSQIDQMDVAPKRYEYNTHNYYPTSSFVAKTHDMAKVDVMATPYPPNDEDKPYLVGEATNTATVDGIQTWKYPVPEGFQATWLYAVGTAANGDFMRSRKLRIIRPIVTASASGTLTH